MNEFVKVPESGGIVNGTVFLVVVACSCRAFVTTDATITGDGISGESQLLKITSGLFSICFMLFLGFTDDVLEWPWRYKLFLPAFASIPLLACYDGSTSILLPTFVRGFLFANEGLTSVGSFVDMFLSSLDPSITNLVNLGNWYLLYMSLLSIFTTNAINIYAGINGLEAGQSFIIAIFVVLHNILELNNTSLSSDNHLFSLMLILPYLAGTFALLVANWYPSKIFVGDTFCYFSGMTFAVVGIHGHFSKTLLLFFIPQIINFILSIPQLAKIVVCPRHRLPSFSAQENIMKPSSYPGVPGTFLTKCLALKDQVEGSETVRCMNLTFINLVLIIFGDMTESKLCTVLLFIQFVFCAAGMAFRYSFIATGVFEE